MMTQKPIHDYIVSVITTNTDVSPDTADLIARDILTEIDNRESFTVPDYLLRDQAIAEYALEGQERFV